MKATKGTRRTQAVANRRMPADRLAAAAVRKIDLLRKSQGLRPLPDAARIRMERQIRDCRAGRRSKASVLNAYIKMILDALA